MKYYQTAYLIDSALSEENAREIDASLQAFVSEQGGILGGAGGPTKKNLASPVKKREFAYLAYFTFRAEPHVLPLLNQKMKGESSILRFLLVEKKPERVSSPSLEQRNTAPKEEKKKVKIDELEKKIEEIVS